MEIVRPDLTFAHAMTPLDSVTCIVLHHSGVNADESAEQINEYHKNVNGWAGIGYHYVIRFDGTIEAGRPEQYQGAHCPGANFCSIGICLPGNFDEAQPLEAQINSLADLLTDLCSRYDLDPTHDIHGHKDYLSTDCPGENLYTQIWAIAALVNNRLHPPQNVPDAAELGLRVPDPIPDPPQTSIDSIERQPDQPSADDTQQQEGQADNADTGTGQ